MFLLQFIFRYCALHTWKTKIKSQRSTAKHVPPTTPEFLISGLSHYVRPVRNLKSEGGEEVKSSSRIRAIDPFGMHSILLITNLQ